MKTGVEKCKAVYAEPCGSEKAAFCSSFAGGMTAHLYCFANTIPNFDGISRVYDQQQMTLAGRWFLHYASGLNSYTQMPMVIGVLEMFFMALAALLTVRLFRIRSRLFAGLWGLLGAVFPAVADINTYTYTAAAYGLAFLLATLGVCLAAGGRAEEKAMSRPAAGKRRERLLFAAGVVCMALSMGIYQMYCTVSITLCMLLLFWETLDRECKPGRLLKKTLRYLLYLCLGAGLYCGILKLFLYYKDIRLWSYLGMSRVEQGYPMEELGGILLKTYRQVWLFFTGASDGLSGAFILIPHCLLGLSVPVLSAALISGRAASGDAEECRAREEAAGRKVTVWPCGTAKSKRLSGRTCRGKRGYQTALVCVILLLLPLGVNFTQIVSPWSQPRLLMKYSFVYYYLLPLLLWQRWEERGGGAGSLRRLKILLAAGALSLAFSFWEYDNLLYTMLNQAHRATLSFVTNLVSRIESCEGYHRGMEVFIVGGFPADRYDTDIEAYGKVMHESALSSSVIPLNKHVYYYMQDWLNVPIEEPSEESFLNIAGLDEFKRMPLYPDYGSVRILEDCIVVKMQENYVPRSQYEKEYEGRK